MLFCQTKDTTFYCRWATSSLPSCCWSLSSSSSSSSHIDTSPKVWRNFCIKIFNWHTNIEYVHIVRTFVPSVFYPQPSTRWAPAHKHTHSRVPLKHTLRCVFLLLRQVWEQSLQLRAFWDGFCWGGRVQPGGQKHRWGTSPPEREGQVCSHCGFKFTVWCVFSDYKNNLLKEKAHLSSPPKVIDLDQGHSYLIFLHVYTWNRP